jgi:hypothetical protein
MPTKKKLPVSVAPALGTLIRPIAARLTSIEDLVVEIRGVLDMHLKRITALQTQVDVLIEAARARR